MNRLICTLAMSLALAAAGCDKPAGTGSSGSTSTSPPKPAASSTAETKPAHAAHGGAVIELGTTQIGELIVRASRDQGEIKAGGDAPIDLWLTTGDGKPAAVQAVRIWIGLEDAKGSVKARADLEDPAQPNHWHTHAEVPSPLPDGAKLWVEIEAAGATTTGAFELKK